MQVNKSSMIVVYLALCVIIGLIVGSLVGYSIAGFRTDKEGQSQVESLQNQISSLQSQLARKDSEISTLRTNILQLERTIEQLRSQLVDRDKQIKDLQDQLSSREQIIRQYREQLTSLENQTIYLQQEINRIANMTRIVQSEKYLLNITGVLSLHSSYSSDERESTYFTTLGKQIKVELKLRTEPPTKADISSDICVYYSFKGASVQVSCKYLHRKDWEFYVHPQANFTFYLKLDKIPENYFGKVPLFIIFSIRIDYPSHHSYLFYELTAYDVYPP